MSSPTTDIPDSRPHPRSPADLFVSFSVLALQGFGGVMAVVQRELVERKKWLTREEFVEEWAVAQIMPGPNVVNMSLMIGARYFGLRGALAALAGMLTLPLLLLLVLAILYAQFAAHPGVAAALKGMSAVAAGLLIATSLKLAASLKKNPLGPAGSAAFGLTAFVATAVLRVPLAWVLLTLGALACTFAYRRLNP